MCDGRPVFFQNIAILASGLETYLTELYRLRQITSYIETDPVRVSLLFLGISTALQYSKILKNVQDNIQTQLLHFF